MSSYALPTLFKFADTKIVASDALPSPERDAVSLAPERSGRKEDVAIRRTSWDNLFPTLSIESLEDNGSNKERSNEAAAVRAEDRTAPQTISVRSATLNPYLLSSQPSPRRSSFQGRVGDSSTNSAIEFHLTITSGVRTYSAIRTLSQVAKLYDDLVLEQIKCKTMYGGSFDSDLEIPPLPSLPSHRTCGGFSQVQTQLETYRPVLERWLREVVASVSSSAPPGEDSFALSSFLWEPVDLFSSRGHGLSGGDLVRNESRDEIARPERRGTTPELRDPTFAALAAEPSMSPRDAMGFPGHDLLSPPLRRKSSNGRRRSSSTLGSIGEGHTLGFE